MTLREVVLVGVGQLGGVFAQGLLRTGVSVVPVRRQDRLGEVAARHPEPQLVLITVGENDLVDVLRALPTGYKDRVALVQNELVPSSWESEGVRAPTIAVVWFEKKPGRVTQIVLPTVVFGPHGQQLVDALQALEIPARLVTTDASTAELVTKNLYILVSNIAGLEVGGNVGALLSTHRALFTAVFDEVVAVQASLVGVELDRTVLMDAVVAAFEGDPEHRCTGRSAPARLARALAHGERLGLKLPTLARIAAKVGAH